MTLKDYYNNLPDSINPRREFREHLAKECGVSVITLYRWLSGEITPDKLKMEKVAEVTGVPAEDLFPQNDQSNEPAE
jgi:transcriptional regulator with XRE-family HTH domain